MSPFFRSKKDRDLDLEVFLENFLTKASSSLEVPCWAAHCTDLFYSSQKVPSVFPDSIYLILIRNEGGKAEKINLRGASKNNKRIDRTLNVVAKGSSIIISSKHLVLETEDILKFEGKGCDFETALSNYFSHSDLNKSDYAFTIDNIQKEGDAFLSQQAMTQEDKITKNLVLTVKKLFQLVPKNKHSKVLEAIKKNYDKDQNAPRLQVIIVSICQHFDALELDSKRLLLRDKLINQFCTDLMEGKNVFLQLEDYLKCLGIHNTLMQAMEGGNLHHDLKDLVHMYKKMELCPEDPQHREKIKPHFEKYQALIKSPLNIPKPR